MLKLDLGAGAVSPEGYTPLGNVNGTQIYPLPAFADGSVDAIRASHVLEHFSFREIPAVLNEWARCLKPGGELKIAVPNFGKIAEDYLAGKPQMTEGYVMGGQTDAADYHKAIFDLDHLKRLMAGAGLMLLRSWDSELQDCADLPVSLNLAGTKPYQPEIRVSGVMSVPRLGFMDNFFCAFESLPPLKISVRRHTGAYWSQCIERVLEKTIEDDNPDAILTLDYDTVFTRRDASMLLQLMCCHPEADAIAAVQSARGKDLALFTLQEADKASGPINVPREQFAGDLMQVATAHFGLTLLRTEKLKVLGKPWFLDVPDKTGGWGEGRRDADIDFWRKWQAAGNSLYLANRVPVGHLDLVIRWPGEDLHAIYQPVSDWRENGPPKELWQ